MDVLVTGSTGLIGKAVSGALSMKGYRVRRLVRRPDERPGGVLWDPARGTIDAAGLDGVDAVVHLAGEPIAGLRWTRSKRERILRSRADGTRLLAETLAGLPSPPAILLSGSAIGFYGNDTHGESVTEASARGEGFLADVCAQWEAATEPAERAGMRVVHLRSGIVLSRAGGVLERQVPLFRSGAGGRLGDGTQWVSWISIHDEVTAILFLLERDDVRGPVNLTSPNPVTNAEFTSALGGVLGRPTFMTVPRTALHLALGRDLADETVLADQKVLPARLGELGYDFRDTEVEPTLLRLLDVWGD